jgi:hypothetical protein
MAPSVSKNGSIVTADVRTLTAVFVESSSPFFVREHAANAAMTSNE